MDRRERGKLARTTNQFQEMGKEKGHGYLGWKVILIKSWSNYKVGRGLVNYFGHFLSRTGIYSPASWQIASFYLYICSKGESTTAKGILFHCWTKQLFFVQKNFPKTKLNHFSYNLKLLFCLPSLPHLLPTDLEIRHNSYEVSLKSFLFHTNPPNVFNCSL